MTKTTVNLGPVPNCCSGNEECVLGYAIFICNSNAITDDDFDVYLNGTKIGTHRAREYTPAGEFWRTDASISRTMLSSVNCPLCEYDYDLNTTCANSTYIIEQALDPALFVLGANTVEMTNTQSNNQNNYGRIWVLAFCKDNANNVRVLEIPLNAQYNGYSYESFSYNFTLTKTIQENCSCPVAPLPMRMASTAAVGPPEAADDPQPRSPFVALEQQAPHGPGTFLVRLLAKLGIHASPTCPCKARARLMNQRGSDWCAENLDTIVGWLREEAARRKLPFVDLAGKLLVRRAIALSRAASALQKCDEPDTPPPAADP